MFDGNSNKIWAQIGGVTLQELNALELEFLFRLEFGIFIDAPEYNSRVAQLYSSLPHGLCIFHPTSSTSATSHFTDSASHRAGRNQRPSRTSGTESASRTTSESYAAVSAGLEDSAPLRVSSPPPSKEDLGQPAAVEPPSHRGTSPHAGPAPSTPASAALAPHCRRSACPGRLDAAPLRPPHLRYAVHRMLDSHPPQVHVAGCPPSAPPPLTPSSRLGQPPAQPPTPPPPGPGQVPIAAASTGACGITRPAARYRV